MPIHLQVIYKFCQSANLGSVCPPDFPYLKVYDTPSHGDICRNELIHGYDIGWVCPMHCVVQLNMDNNGEPFCLASITDTKPCRVNSGTELELIYI